MRDAIVRRRALRTDREGRATFDPVTLPHVHLRLIQRDALLRIVEIARAVTGT
jgi:hypothetical protein